MNRKDMVLLLKIKEIDMFLKKKRSNNHTQLSDDSVYLHS